MHARGHCQTQQHTTGTKQLLATLSDIVLHCGNPAKGAGIPSRCSRLCGMHVRARALLTHLAFQNFTQHCPATGLAAACDSRGAGQQRARALGQGKRYLRMLPTRSPSLEEKLSMTRCG